MTNLPDAKAKQLPVSGSTSLGSPMATTAPKTVKKDGTVVVRPSVAPPRAKAAPRKTATKKPVAKKAAPAKQVAVKPMAKKATPVSKSTSKPAAKKAVAKKPMAKKPVAKKAAAKPAAKKAVAKKTTIKKAVAKKPVAKKAVKKAVAKKTTIKKAVAKKPLAKKAVAKKPVAKKAVKKAVAKKTTIKKAVAKKPLAKKPVATKAIKKAVKKPIAKKGATSARVKAASASLGESVYKQVEGVIATGRTAKDAFVVVSKDRKMTPSNVQQHYYRFKRKATTGGKKATKSSRKTVSKVQSRAVGAAATAVAKLPAKQRKQVARGVVGASKRAQSATAVTKEIRGDLSQVLEDMFASINEVLTEARKNPQFKKVEKRVAARFTR